MKLAVCFLLPCLSMFVLSSCKFDNATNSAYNVASRAGVFASEDTMFVIGVEKFSRRKAGLTNEHDVQLFKPSAVTHPEIAASHPEKLDELESRLNTYLESGWRSMTVSHIVKSDDRQRIHFPYNLRALKESEATPEARMATAFASGQKAVADWARTDLPRTFQEATRSGRPYSHVFVMCMGWVNDQEESVMRFRNISRQIVKEAHQQGDRKFRPLVIGFSWPSGWLTNADSTFSRTIGHVFSYPGKSSDADELGLRLICPIVFQHLRPAIPKGVPLVGIGHSFGARAMSRAAYSLPLLKGASGDQFDLLISLQGAYSLRRWIPEESGEGVPYLIANPPPHVITSSKADRANPYAFWSRHVGSGRSFKKAEGLPGRFETITWDSKRSPNFVLGRVPVVVNAEEFVTGTTPSNSDAYGITPRDGHNDILNVKTGQFIYELLKKLP